MPSWISPSLWGAATGAVAMSIVGFSWLGWTGAAASERMATERANAAVLAALVPICVARGEAAEVGALAKLRAETSSYNRSTLVQNAGWATLPGMARPEFALAQACAEKLAAAK